MSDEPFPQTWNVSVAPHDAFCSDSSIAIRCGGRVIQSVRAYSVPEGWVIGLCLDPDGLFHRHPLLPMTICERVYHGKVEITRESAP